MARSTLSPTRSGVPRRDLYFLYKQASGSGNAKCRDDRDEGKLPIPLSKKVLAPSWCIAGSRESGIPNPIGPRVFAVEDVRKEDRFSGVPRWAIQCGRGATHLMTVAVTQVPPQSIRSPHQVVRKRQ